MAYDQYTLPMMKDTNNLRIVLQDMNGDPVDYKDFNFEVIADNILMNWKNDVVPTQFFSYKQWAQGQVLPGLYPDGSEVKSAYAEFSFGRLIYNELGSNDPDNYPRLRISRRSDDSDVVNIPLINYLLMLKSDSFSKMVPQEFLDRESRWNMIFFLDRHWKWVYVQIIVNDWVVRINNPELTN